MNTNQQQLVDQDCYRVALVLPKSRAIIVERHGRFLRLPRIVVPRWTRRAEQLAKACYRKWHVRSIVVDFLATETLEPPCVAIEVLTRDWDPSAHGFQPIQIDEVDERELTESERVALHSIVEGDSLNRGPFSRLGWIDEAKEWIQASVADRILEFSGDVRGFNAQGRFALVRFGTAHGPAYWLKATGAPNAHEFAVTKTLARYLPSYLPTVVATREDWNAWIMEDSGRPLRDSASLRSFEQAVSTLAGLQKASTPHLEELLASGCLDQRMPILRAHLPEMTRYLAEIMAKQTSTKVPPLPSERLQELGDILDEACVAIDKIGIPETLIHNDMNGGNILFDGTRAVFTDWAEAFIGNPLFTFHHLRAQALREDSKWVPRLTVSYKQYWRAVLNDSQIERALALTQPLAIVSYLFGRDPSFISEYRRDARHQSYARSLARHMERVVHAAEFRRALCKLSVTIPEPVTEILHGVTVSDPFRWLEDRTSEVTSSWLAAQKTAHDAYFREMSGLEVLRPRVSSYLNVDVLDQPAKVAGRFFYRRRRKDQEQGCICVQDTLNGQERVLVDPSRHGPFASVGIHRISPDGALLAYQLKFGGSDAMEIHFVVTATGQQLPDSLPLGYARGLLFAKDGSGFLYCHEDLSRVEDHAIRFHAFGTASNDIVLFCRRRTPSSRLVLTGDDRRLGAIYRHEAGGEFETDLYCANGTKSSEWIPAFTNRRCPYEPFFHRGRTFAFTEENAANGKLIELSEDGREIRVVVPESESRIEQYTSTGEAIYVRYLLERQSIVRAYALDGTPVETVPLPRDGTIQILPRLTTNPDCLFFAYESFGTAPTIYKYQSESRAATVIARTPIAYSPQGIRVDQHWCTSYDGTEIPLSLVMRRDLDLTTLHPVVMTSYGGFGISMTPKFSVLVALLVELGAIFALPGIRGGSEFGKEWHEAARKRNRQVSISDFIAAAEWVSRWHSSSPRPIGTFGGSNSGLLVVAAMTQRPDLFRAVLSIAPLLDMVRYELFDNARKWRQEYGTVEDREDFGALYGYSPYHHVADGVDYPATLFVAGDGDDRCNPAHARKMAARLQERPAQRQPVLVDYSAERGHSPVLPLSVRTDALTRRIAFLCKELSIAVPEGGPL